MKKKYSEDYIPVNCIFVDQIEHLATLKEDVIVHYMINDTKHKQSGPHKIVTWENDGEAEYVIFDSGLRLRLDHINSLNGMAPDGTCDSNI